MLPSRDGASDIVAATALVESFVDDEISAVLERRKSSSTALELLLLRKFGGDFRRTWPDRVQFLEKGVGLGDVPSKLRQNLFLVIDARNAVVHGRGELTPNQLGNESKALILRRELARKLNVRSSGTRLQFADETSTASVRILIEFCYWLDEALSQQPDVS